MSAPTLLIGLGGLGASIVQEIHARVPEIYRPLVGVHILDTDANELMDSRYRSIDPNQLTQTSDAITVGQCLDKLKNSTHVEEWFPVKQGISSAVMHKQMTLGASQFRAVSRLALLDTMASGRLDALNRALNDTMTARGNQFEQSVRVMIVNSLAGGTGSGSFLQIALYVRDYFEKRLKTQNVVVRGIVVMPEVFVQARDYAGPDLIENVRANGYAALKEIDALMRVRAGQITVEPSASPIHPVALEYQPGQRDASRIEPGKTPFDFIFLYDFVRSNGDNLGAKSNYINQAAEALYLQLFSPLVTTRSGIYSQEDNLLLTLAASQDRARLASSGVAKLIYPHQDIVEYSALKWATTGLSNEWLELDRLIDEELRQNEQDRRAGIHRSKPERHVRFVELLNQKAGTANPVPFYRLVHQEAHLLDENGHIVSSKAAGWLEAVKARMDESFKQADVQAMQKLPVQNVELLKIRDDAGSNFERYERDLNNYQDSLTKATQPLANMIVQEALWNDYRSKSDFTPGQDIRLNTWLLAKDKAIHPVAARYMLSEIRMALESQLQEIEPELGRIQRGMTGYKSHWDDPMTDDITETAGMIAERHAQANWLRHKLQKPLHGFAEEYLAAYESQRSTIAKWASKQLEQSVLSLLCRHVADLLGDWETFFSRLGNVQEACENEISLSAGKHEESIDPTRIFVCASVADKEKLWEEECIEMRAQEMPAEVSKQICLALYRRRAKVHFDEAPGRTSGWEEELFRDHVVGWCRNSLRGHSGLDLDIKAAIDLELRYAQANGKRMNESDDDAFKMYVMRLDHLAIPALEKTEKTKQNFEFWCLNSGVKEKIGERLLQETIGEVHVDGHIHKGGARDDAVAFPRQELTFVRLSYGISAGDLSSMTDPQGIYRQAYEARIKKAWANPPTSFSPHLDWRWDSPAFLPEIDDKAQSKAMLDLRRATCYNLLKKSPYYIGEDDGVKRWERVNKDGIRQVLTGPTGKSTAPTVEGLYLGLGVHYYQVKPILDQYENEVEAGRRDPDALPLIVGLGAVFDQLLTVPAHADTKAEGETMATYLIATLCGDVIDLYKNCGEKPNTARDRARTKFHEVLEKSEVLQHPDKHGVEPCWAERGRQQAVAFFA